MFPVYPVIRVDSQRNLLPLQRDHSVGLHEGVMIEFGRNCLIKRATIETDHNPNYPDPLELYVDSAPRKSLLHRPSHTRNALLQTFVCCDRFVPFPKIQPSLSMSRSNVVW
jgi:hypothetical protein